MIEADPPQERAFTCGWHIRACKKWSHFIDSRIIDRDRARVHVGGYPDNQLSKQIVEEGDRNRPIELSIVLFFGWVTTTPDEILSSLTLFHTGLRALDR